MSEFLHMGGYAAFVWPSIGLTVVVLIGNIIAPILKHRAALQKASDFHAGKSDLYGENS